jgi:hypothetical protein
MRTGGLHVKMNLSVPLIEMSSRRGGLLELVARGKKDLYFNSNPKVSFFHSIYIRAAPFAEEVYVSLPRNNPEWGRWVEFDIEHRGDLVRGVYLLIDLPTWLPQSVADICNRSLITDHHGVSYGYCNNIGYQIINKIQLCYDQVIVQELYGEHLDWSLRQSATSSVSKIVGDCVGGRGNTAIDIARAACPNRLRVPIPIVGWEKHGDAGFPMVCMRKQSFKLRVLLRKLDEVIEASDGRTHPNPFSMPIAVQRSKNGPVTHGETTLPRSALEKSITMSLETTQVYVQKDVHEWLRIQKWTVPFRNVQMQMFEIEDNQWNAAATASVTNFTLPFRLDFTGPVSRLLIAMQTEGARFAGRRTELLETGVRDIRLHIANINRVEPIGPIIMRDFASYWRENQAAASSTVSTRHTEVYTLPFGGKDREQPAGTLNFTRATQPELWVRLGSIPVDMRSRNRKTFMTVYAESWRLWEMHDSKGMIVVDE